MPSAAAARAELAPARAGAGPFAFSLAAPADDAAIRRLLRQQPLPGTISLSFEREPDTALAAAAEGGAHQTLIARRATGEIAGIAARSVRTVFINGQARSFGYLGQLRVVDGRHRLRALIDDGFAFCRAVHEDAGDAPAYLMSLVADNDPARRLLIERRSVTAPRFDAADRLQTFLIPAQRAPRASARAPIRVEQGTSALLGDIAACLRRNLRRYQFAPSWTEADLVSSQTTGGPSPDDFAVAATDDGVVGCVALWDQRAFKQIVVRGYTPLLARIRPLANAAARGLGLPPLPAIGATLPFAYLSHVAVDDDRGDVLDALIAAQVRRARVRGLDYVVTGFPDRHPLQAIVRQSWARRTYHSTLYVAYWPDGEACVRSLDSRPGQPEVAVL